jgi:heme/copper-type cytochrome/quinol oxidase subunit 3
MTSVTYERGSQPRGWWGVALLVATEGTLFGTIFGAYWYLRFKALAWPPAGIPEPKVLLPLVLTGVLVATSAPMQLVYRAGRRERVGAARLLLLLALVVQAGYLGMQIHLFAADLRDFVPSQHAYASIYYVLVGADHAHVAAGLLINAFLLLKLLSGLNGYRLTGLKAAAFYWHFVNLLTVAVVLTQISPAL